MFTAFNFTAQAEEIHTVACTAGNLATLTAGYKATITDLTVTGTIDARDFKTMRDDMPLLAVIDLSGSTVLAYSGTAGTAGTASTVYLANGIPDFAFYNSSSSIAKKSLKSFIYPASVSSIGSSAFWDCSGFAGSLTIPISVTTIGNWAFGNCKGFNGSLTIPSSVTIIGEGAFSHCSGFTGSLIIPLSITTIGHSAFYNCRGFVGSLTIPSSVTTIGFYAFSHCSGLTGSLAIPSLVTIIGDGAFVNCSGFSGTLTIPSSVTTIGDGAFGNFRGLIDVDLANANYSSLDGVLFNKSKTMLIQCPTSKTGKYTIPSSVTTIGDYAFGNCNSITSIYTLSTTPINISASLGVFSGININTCVLHVPENSKILYTAADQWQDFTNIVEDIPNSIDEVLNSSISIFPNPATTLITISELSSLVSDKTVTLSITDVSGRTLFSQDIEPSLNTLTIDVSTFNCGIYFIAIQTCKGSVIKRFVKNRFIRY